MEQNWGSVVAVRGSAVDVQFDRQLPPIASIITIGDEVVMEVLTQIDAHRVRCIALTPTQGLSRGSSALDTVGPGVLFRMFDVFGRTIDRGVPVSGVTWQFIQREPPALSVRSTKSELFETGIKAIDVLVPL